MFRVILFYQTNTMKQNLSTTLNYFVYLGIALLMQPSTPFVKKTTQHIGKEIVKEIKAEAPREEDLLHGDLFFKY